MDWILVIKIAATAVLAVISVGLVWIMITAGNGYEDNPGTGY